ncbi:zona pellucida sperm-binding protein 3-like [Genypterus blacodes]|uniref:zona pellucida sperm-binding protein 3-like n=1 Tax=Genypterus blacodes TaxID=154954 RepID=UPI003F759D9E
MLEAKPESKFEQWDPMPAESVAVQCSETGVHVEVRQNLLGNNQLIHPADLSLGGCEARRVDSANQLIIYESDLHSCGSQQTMTEDSLIYTFTLIYEPSALANTPILKTSAAMTYIQCYYHRKHNVSSDDVMPAWTPYTATKVAAESFYFSLNLMTDDWKFKRASNQYFLGDVINIEASVSQYNHMPIRLFVDYCVATLEPDMNAEPKYVFIQNLGCLVDSKFTGSKSQFRPRSQDDKLHIQLEAFRFQQQSSDSIYIVCNVRAESISASAVISGESKACSFIDGWRSADANDEACGCCDTGCSGPRTARDVMAVDPMLEGETILGPIEIKM